MKALALISGGLDSLLATQLVLAQGIQVEGVNFFNGFAGDHDFLYRKQVTGHQAARRLAKQLGIKLHRIDITERFKQVFFKPVHGYGKHLNPCIDCKLFMIKEALKLMRELKLDFLISGEVVGQRPMSQRLELMPLATELTEDLIVRPLSAQLLPPTYPERQGWLKRELLGKISGRGRQPQLQLARDFNFQELPQPAGGCLLTDQGFCRRLHDLVANKRDYDSTDLWLLRTGRHYRFNSSIKLVVGRDEVENQFLVDLAVREDLKWLQTISCPGAVVVVVGEVGSDLIPLVGVAAYFSKGRNQTAPLAVGVHNFAKNLIKVESKPILPADLVLI